MSVTKQLLELFRVDKQLRGLRSRLDGAERFLTTQTALLGDLDKQKTTLESQVKHLRAVIANEEGEAARIEARTTTLREQMNSAKTAKEYNAFLTELNTLKEQKTAADEKVLESMGKVEESEKKLAEVLIQHTERAKIAGTARTDRDSKNAEIKDRLAELTTQRQTLTVGIPPRELKMLDDLIKARGDEAMSPVEVLDRRSHEGSCSACMMAIPVEAVSALMSGKLMSCPSCRCILYVEEETFSPVKKVPAPTKPKGKSKPTEEVAKT
jgi:predicted  nucleic acid-binding Zn-ribbon protein